MKRDLIIIAGPTAVGKTDLSLSIAKELNGEIISADSMQIYKEMDIGSAKITKEEMGDIRHHLIDCVSPDTEFSVAEFKELATKAIDDIYSRGKVPIIAGGTGLYINSLVFNYNFAESNKDDIYREELYNVLEEKGKDYLYELLKDVDSESYNRLCPNDVKRIVRALEVYKVTGKTIRELNDEVDKLDIPYKVKYFVLTMDREKLYERINRRVEIMIEKGLLDEVKALRDKGYTEDMQSMKGIGYKELLKHLNGEIDFDTAIDDIKKGSRNYAKRQLTWFRKDDRVVWINKDEFNSEEAIKEKVLGLIKEDN